LLSDVYKIIPREGGLNDILKMCDDRC